MNDLNILPLSEFDRQCLQAYQTWEQMGRPTDEAKVADALGIKRRTLTNRLLKFFIRDLGARLPVPILPGHEVKTHTQVVGADGEVRFQSIRTALARSDEPFEVPEGHRVKGISALVGGDGSKLQEWIKTEAVKGTDQEAVIESIRLAAQEAFSVATRAVRDMEESAGRQATTTEENLLNLHPLPDLHLGLYVWGKHCGISWDLATAIETLRATMLNLMVRAPKAKRGVILGGGDLLHADDETKKTRRSGHVLDVDGRYPKVLLEAELLLVYQAELALEKYEEVVIRILPGNHDDDSSVAVTHFLYAWFKDDPRVTVELDPGPFFFHQWGATMLAGVHGHETKIEDMKDVMAADRKTMWGETDYRYAHGFHYHTLRTGGEKGGAQWEVHRTPIPRDAYANDNGFRSGRSMQVISYDLVNGEEGRTIKNL